MFISKVLQENSHESVYNYRVSIQDKLRQFKGVVQSTDFILTALIIVVSLTSFFLGRISVGEGGISVPVGNSASLSNDKTEVLNVTKASTSAQSISAHTQKSVEKMYVASKSGTKYHLPWCGSAGQIKEENKIWFASKEEAEKAGYTPASNCKGI